MGVSWKRCGCLRMGRCDCLAIVCTTCDPPSHFRIFPLLPLSCNELQFWALNLSSLFCSLVMFSYLFTLSSSILIILLLSMFLFFTPRGFLDNPSTHLQPKLELFFPPLLSLTPLLLPFSLSFLLLTRSSPPSLSLP